MSAHATKWRWVPHLKCRWVLPPLKMCYQALKNNTNSALKGLEWVKDGLCIYCGGCVFTLIDKMGIVKFSILVKFDLEGQDPSTPKTIGILIKVFCIFHFCPNLHGLKSGLTHRHTHTQIQAMTIAEGQNWPQVKRAKMSEKKRGTYGLIN